MGRLALSLRAALAAALFLAATTGAAEISGVAFSERIRAADAPLVLANVALLRWKLFFHPYAGALYVGDGVDPKRWREDVPKRLELHYFYSIPGKDFGPAGEEVLARNVPPETMKVLATELAEISRLYADVKPGDRYALTYVPGVGTELAINGKALGTVRGAAFSAAYFAIWLGADPISGAFRDSLLERRAVSSASADASLDLDASSLRGEAGARLVLQLPSGGTVALERERIVPSGEDRFDWIGRVVGESGDRVVLSVRAEHVLGAIRAGGRQYEIRPAGGSGRQHVVVEIDPARFRED